MRITLKKLMMCMVLSTALVACSQSSGDESKEAESSTAVSSQASTEQNETKKSTEKESESKAKGEDELQLGEGVNG